MLRPGRGLLLILIGLTVISGVVFSRPAKADPHAVFYTAVGQQQLFFNMLAALDQADYVEPADGDNSRDLLIQARDRAGFGPETDERLNATKTDLASVLTRSVTLEGNDMWSSYLALQFALEASRRNNTDELIRILCERGFGRKACRTDLGGDLEEEQKTAFVVDPAEREAVALKAALEGSLSSGTSIHEDMIRGIVSGDDSYGGLAGNQLPNSEAMAQLRENSSGDTGKNLAVERGVGNSLNMYRNTGVNPAVFDDLNVDTQTGNVTLTDNAPKSTANYISKVLGLINFSVSVQEEAANSAAVARTHLAQTESQGSVADTRDEPVIENGRATAINSKISVPAGAKMAAGLTALDSVSRMTSNSAFAPAVADYKPGDETLVGSDEAASGGPIQCKDIEDPDEDDGCNSGNVRGDTSCTTSGGAAGTCVLDYEMRPCYLGNTPTRTEVAHYYCQAGNVRGATTTNQGQVAGLIDWLEWLWDLYSQPKEPELDSSTNPIGFQHESAAHDLYEAMGLSDENGNDGTMLNNTLGASNTFLMNSINGF